MAREHNHYFKDVSNLQFIDVYQVLKLFGVTDPCIQHAVKKLLVAGGRGAGKDISKDIKESIDSLQRWQEMQEEKEQEGKQLEHFKAVLEDALGMGGGVSQASPALNHLRIELLRLYSLKGKQ